jgi:hypothetical protein
MASLVILAALFSKNPLSMIRTRSRSQSVTFLKEETIVYNIHELNKLEHNINELNQKSCLTAPWAFTCFALVAYRYWSQFLTGIIWPVPGSVTTPGQWSRIQLPNVVFTCRWCPLPSKEVSSQNLQNLSDWAYTKSSAGKITTRSTQLRIWTKLTSHHMV